MLAEHELSINANAQIDAPNATARGRCQIYKPRTRTDNH
jgi:hypothetical protein